MSTFQTFYNYGDPRILSIYQLKWIIYRKICFLPGTKEIWTHWEFCISIFKSVYYMFTENAKPNME